MKRITFALAVLALFLCGCQSPRQAERMVGSETTDLDGLPAPVLIKGNVRQPVIPWSDDLTVSKALLAAEYLGARDPLSISIRRRGERLFVNPTQLVQGIVDPWLDAGDIIELHTTTPLKPANNYYGAIHDP